MNEGTARAGTPRSGGDADSPEFALLLACLRWPQADVDGDAIRSLAQQPLRWPWFLAMVHHHKVAPLVARNLDTFAAGYLPEAPAAALRSADISNAHICLRRVSHLLTLTHRFRELAIPFRIFKGIPLAMTAYGDPTLRDCGDTDLLVGEHDLLAAGEILRAEGYVRFEPQGRLTPRRLRSYIAHQKDFSYTHPGGVVIDLHWRLFRNARLPGNGGLQQAGEQPLALGKESIPALPGPRLLHYLCLHGALDGWLRLKWLADIRALLHALPAEEVAAAAAMARETGGLPAFSAALLLCHDLLGPLPGALPGALPPQWLELACLDREHPAVSRLLAFSRRCLTSNSCCPVRELVPSTAWFLNEFHLHTALRYRLELIHRSLFRPRIWSSIPLPDWLFPLYVLLSPFEWFGFHVRRHLALRRQARAARGRPRKRQALHSMRRRRAADIALAMEAACMLGFFRIALGFLPVEKLVAWMKNSDTAPALAGDRVARTLRRVEWSIAAVVRHAPVKFVCFPQCLAAYFMLRRRHIASTLFYGVTREQDQLKAHTWVKVGERMIVGGEAASSFTVLNTFP